MSQDARRPAIQTAPPPLPPRQWPAPQQTPPAQPEKRGAHGDIVIATILAGVAGLVVFAIWMLVFTAAGGSLGLALPLSLIAGYLAAVYVRGLHTWGHRRAVLREWINDYPDSETRNVETYRYIFWNRVFRLTRWILGLLILAGLLGLLPPVVVSLLGAVVPVLVYVIFIFVAQFLIFFGPFVIYGSIGRDTLQPGDASFEVSMDDVRGQKPAVAEIKSILNLMQQGRNFIKAGGKRERGVLMVGPPGTGKTMLAKAIASSLDVPILITSGASFAGMFMGMDVLNVFMLVRKAKKMARAWGGCVIFIDEFDALGNRRSGMGGGGGMLGGMFTGGGMMGLNMLLVLMDGVDRPSFFGKLLRRLVNGVLDGLYLPRRLAGARLRLPNLRPPNYNLLFVGATNRPSVLDEAVTRPGRFGRQIIFRNPTREGRKDVADLYFSRKRHDPEMDSPARRDEFARITAGYSPAEIEQALSLALMYAFERNRDYFTWQDLREAMANVESGLAVPFEYTERERLGIARHEVGHAVAATFYMPDRAHSRLSIKMRSDGSGGRHGAIKTEEEFVEMRSQMAGSLRWGLGALASERVFYGENSSGVTGDLISVTNEACRMVGVTGMGPDELTPELSRKAIEFGEYLISVVEITSGMHEGGSIVGAVLGNPKARRTVAQVLGAAYVDDWRLMHVNKEAIDQAAEALIMQEELMGDEIKGLLDSVGLRLPTDADPYPPALPRLPRADEDEPKRLPDASAPRIA